MKNEGSQNCAEVLEAMTFKFQALKLTMIT